MNRWTSLFALLLCACGSSEPPPPSIVSVTPARLSTSECVPLTVGLEGTLPLKLDYGKGSAELFTQLQMEIGDQKYSVARTEDHGRLLTAELPAGLPMGPQDVRVTLQDGRQALLPDGLEVTPPLVIEAFRFDIVPNQIRHEPFTVTIRVTGRDARLFQGRVRLRSNGGSLKPDWSEPFKDGLLVQEVTINGNGGTVLFVEMQDCTGRTVNSNEFRLESPRP